MPNQYTAGRENRLKAIEEGKKTYQGSTACKTCGSYEKYVSTSSCAPCCKRKGLEKLNNKELMAKYKTPDKLNRKQRKWRAENTDKLEEQRLRADIKRYGYHITEEQYKAQVEAQSGRCDICNKECGRGRLSIDHDHNTDKVRGLLCRSCNLGLGNFNDNIDFLTQAVLYLKKYE